MSLYLWTASFSLRDSVGEALASILDLIWDCYFPVAYEEFINAGFVLDLGLLQFCVYSSNDLLLVRCLVAWLFDVFDCLFALLAFEIQVGTAQ
jgi:hypothetical protein